MTTAAAAPPPLELAFEAHIEVGAPLVVGRTPAGERRIVGITGGRFAGPLLAGRVLAGGADWQLVRTDGVAEIDARYTLETNRGELIYVVNRGLRHGPAEVIANLAAGREVDPALYYFRTAPTFETAAVEHAWLTRSLFVSFGERHPAHVLMRFWRVK